MGLKFRNYPDPRPYVNPYITPIFLLKGPPIWGILTYVRSIFLLVQPPKNRDSLSSAPEAALLCMSQGVFSLWVQEEFRNKGQRV